MKNINDLFDLSGNNTDIRTELVAGATTFIATMYIIIVNPAILSQGGMHYEAVLTATILVSAFSSIMMGLYANNPIIVAPGMGINAYFTYSLVLGKHLPVDVALGTVFWSGVIFLLLSIFKIRFFILQAIPEAVRHGSAAGIGLFIALIGLVNAGLVAVKTPFIGMAPLNSLNLTFVAGLLIAAVLTVKQVRGALILSVILTTLLAWPIGRWYGDASAVNFGNPVLVTVERVLSMPDFSYLLRMNLVDSLQWAILPAAFGLLFTDLFDSIATFVGVAEAGNLKNGDGELRNIRQSLIVDALATLSAGMVGSSSGTAYIESASGIQAGGRTGLTAVFAGLLFLPFLFVAPLAKVVPSIATAPVLVIVGAYMMSSVMRIAWDDYENALPAFIALLLIPLTYSITQGVVWGLLLYTALKVVTGKSGELSKTLLAIDLFSLLLLYLNGRG
ncbi:MAG: NCS2 family permease [Gammaproteobacteria bacterium]